MFFIVNVKDFKECDYEMMFSRHLWAVEKFFIAVTRTTPAESWFCCEEELKTLSHGLQGNKHKNL
jgi:hypothetical protein